MVWGLTSLKHYGNKAPICKAPICKALRCKPEEVGHAPNCIMVEAINQSGVRIFLGVNLGEIVARGMKRISLRVSSALTSLVS